ncbi:phosphate ABC transporter permease protein [Marinilactibacillus psychrotolerans]|uniref:Phosphate transport system permease protein n=3 Tax=Marinilactibacillus psychrotolerans TaxID=191770 RepID=A0AAV3WRI6_9LACT|nr:phosphate transport system permease protein [Marinilactibacillus psychrotolerans]GEQ33327.1 phosphate ABC transporter permease protein [Marinilactibacillus psychrotolerans]GEQ35750.1 phosphate ABC transporter permease protein [Marinilactibacillus psychrotolerans]SDC35056.1 phosphate ABC transporter membrane protein 1, PhoT family (TC 3.A.1.7.1) [Marinilactibacillus psychrotolerans]SJN36113.1 Phosphate transport system permease protein PstC (TC 3.A.1.7.1) [Marinilactibacillus psychrotolerans 
MKNSKEMIMKGIFFLSACFSIVALLLIVVFIFANGVPFMLDYGFFKFIFGMEWTPTNSPASYGIFPMIIGSIYVTLGAAVVGVPIGVMTAIFMADFCPPFLYKILKPAVNLMAAIPSIVYGFFALQVFTPLIRQYFGGNGYSVLTASILLGIMILPTVISLSESALRAVPRTYYTGSIALGATHERSIFRVLLPAAKSGIISSIILGIGRAIGETMAVVLIAGNQAIIPDSLLSGVRTLTTNIVIEMAYATGEHRDALIATAVVLFGFILLINSIFLYFKNKEAKY